MTEPNIGERQDAAQETSASLTPHDAELLEVHSHDGLGAADEAVLEAIEDATLESAQADGEPVPQGPPERALIHIGAPKTATTMLQSWLRSNRKRFASRGVGVYLPRQVRHNRYLGKYMKFYRGRIEEPQTEDFLQVFASETARKVILSEEALSNDFIPARDYENGGFDAIERTIRFLKALPIPEIRVLLTVRRQDKFLKSSYSHRVRRAGVTCGFDQWVQQEAAVENMSWLKVVDRLEARLWRAQRYSGAFRDARGGR